MSRDSALALVREGLTSMPRVDAQHRRINLRRSCHSQLAIGLSQPDAADETMRRDREAASSWVSAPASLQVVLIRTRLAEVPGAVIGKSANT